MQASVVEATSQCREDSGVRVFPLALADDFETLPYLSLGMVVAYLRVYDDCQLNRSYSIERLRLGGVDGYPVEPLLETIASSERCICLLSAYVWNKTINIATAREIKRRNPQAIIIIGGPEVPKYVEETERFLDENPAMDIAVLGEGEVACAEILTALTANNFTLDSLSNITGIVYRGGSSIVRTAERQRLKDINVLPSPYLTGEFEPWFLDHVIAILETNRGCPYGCTYCDWGSATLEKVSKFDPARVSAEIDYIAEKRAQTIFIADANLGMLEQDIDYAAALVAAKARTGFPKRLYSNFAKNGGRRLMTVIKTLHEGGLLEAGIIALQTTDKDVLKAIKRDNIKTESYEKLMHYFTSEKIPMASDIMIGLPGQTIDSLQGDLQFCFDWKVSANGNFTSMMPNAPMAEKSYREKFQIVADADGLIASTSTFTREDMAYMKLYYMVYQFHVSLGSLKYYLYYMQIEHGIPALALLRKWLDYVLDSDPRLPLSKRVLDEIFNMPSRRGDWALLSWGDEAAFLFSSFEAYCDEVHRFVQDEYALDIEESVFNTLKTAQSAVMPRPGRSYPFESELPHNLNAYMNQVKTEPNVSGLKQKIKPLHTYPPSKLNVNPLIRKIESVKFVKQDGHADGWELRSPLRFYNRVS
jgi:radical SAM superfamily enzyme YgiQ (UPF0313 family)